MASFACWCCVCVWSKNKRRAFRNRATRLIYIYIRKVTHLSNRNRAVRVLTLLLLLLSWFGSARRLAQDTACRVICWRRLTTKTICALNWRTTQTHLSFVLTIWTLCVIYLFGQGPNNNKKRVARTTTTSHSRIHTHLSVRYSKIMLVSSLLILKTQILNAILSIVAKSKNQEESVCVCHQSGDIKQYITIYTQVSICVFYIYHPDSVQLA